MKNSLFIFCMMMLAAGSGCKHTIETPVPIPDPPEEGACDPDSIYFERDVLPILISNCAMSGCHDAGTGQNGVFLHSYASVMNSDADVDPFNPFDSELYERITDSDPDKRMPPPPKDPLTQQQINIIYNWISQGALNKTCNDSSACDSTTTVSYSADLVPLFQSNCTGCHGGSAPSGGINLTTHGGVQAVATNGSLYGAVNHAVGYSPMPQGGNKLPACDITKIRKWIQDGAPNN